MTDVSQDEINTFLGLIEAMSNANEYTSDNVPPDVLILNMMRDNLPKFLVLCSTIVLSDNVNISYMGYALIFIHRALSNQHSSTMHHIFNIWSDISDKDRILIKQAVFRGLMFSDVVIRNSASSVISLIAEVEMPRGMWTDLFEFFAKVLVDENYDVDTKRGVLSAIQDILSLDFLHCVSNYQTDILPSVFQCCMKILNKSMPDDVYASVILILARLHPDLDDSGDMIFHQLLPMIDSKNPVLRDAILKFITTVYENKPYDVFDLCFNRLLTLTNELISINDISIFDFWAEIAKIQNDFSKTIISSMLGSIKDHLFEISARIYANETDMSDSSFTSDYSTVHKCLKAITMHVEQDVQDYLYVQLQKNTDQQNDRLFAALLFCSVLTSYSKQFLMNLWSFLLTKPGSGKPILLQQWLLTLVSAAVIIQESSVTSDCLMVLLHHLDEPIEVSLFALTSLGKLFKKTDAISLSEPRVITKLCSFFQSPDIFEPNLIERLQVCICMFAIRYNNASDEKHACFQEAIDSLIELLHVSVAESAYIDPSNLNKIQTAMAQCLCFLAKGHRSFIEHNPQPILNAFYHVLRCQRSDSGTEFLSFITIIMMLSKVDIKEHVDAILPSLYEQLESGNPQAIEESALRASDIFIARPNESSEYFERFFDSYINILGTDYYRPSTLYTVLYHVGDLVSILEDASQKYWAFILNFESAIFSEEKLSDLVSDAESLTLALRACLYTNAQILRSWKSEQKTLARLKKVFFAPIEIMVTSQIIDRELFMLATFFLKTVLKSPGKNVFNVTLKQQSIEMLLQSCSKYGKEQNCRSLVQDSQFLSSQIRKI